MESIADNTNRSLFISRSHEKKREILEELNEILETMVNSIFEELEIDLLKNQVIVNEKLYQIKKYSLRKIEYLIFK